MLQFQPFNREVLWAYILLSMAIEEGTKKALIVKLIKQYQIKILRSVLFSCLIGYLLIILSLLVYYSWKVIMGNRMWAFWISD